MVINFYKNCNFEVNESVFRELLEIYNKADALPSGRKTAKLVDYKEKKYILKKESRGGLFISFFPDKFFSLSVFQKEIEINKLLEENGLTVPIILRFWKKHNILNEIYTLTPYLDNSFSLKEIVLKDDLDTEKINLAGKTVAKMHKIGLFHFDLNLGNLIFDEKNCYVIDLRNSYIYDSPLNKSLSRKNLFRVLRSYLKETEKAKKVLDCNFLDFFLEGYLSERKEDWVKKVSFNNILNLRRLIYKIRF